MFLWLPHFVKKLFKICSGDICADLLTAEDNDIYVELEVKDCE